MAYQSKIKSENTDTLSDAILSLKSKEECYRSFEDICVVKELQSIAQGLEVVELLVPKKTYHDIEQETGASTATISRINRALNYGADGYKLALEGLDYIKQKSS